MRSIDTAGMLGMLGRLGRLGRSIFGKNVKLGEQLREKRASLLASFFALRVALWGKRYLEFIF
jgi:hypothetical protein